MEYPVALDHEELLVRRGRRSGLYTMVAIHSTVRGPALGGCRMWTYDDARAAMRDALRLSQAMTLKSAVAALPLGGGKGVVMLPAEQSAGGGAGGPNRAPGRGAAISPARRRDALLDFADTVAALDGRYMTAEDVGTSARDMQVIARGTRYVTGLSRKRGGSGDPSPWTALGVEAAIRVSVQEALGVETLRGRSVAVVGLGHVGARLAKGLAKAGAKLIAADIDPAKRALADELGARWMTPESALRAQVDVVAPCALGGVLDHETAPALRCAVVAGAANNQLADDVVADLLHARGILWAPDFVANAGGIINIAVELEPDRYDPRRARQRVNGIADTLRRIYADARAIDATPLTAAHELARRNLVAP